MNRKAIITELAGLRERFDAPYNLADRNTIERLYLEVCGRHLNRGCQNCYHDAVIEIHRAIKQNNIMNEKNYWLKNGAVIVSPTFHGGEIFTNANLTDEVAAEYLQLFPNRANLFAKLPEAPKKAKRPRKPKAEKS